MARGVTRTRLLLNLALFLLLLGLVVLAVREPGKVVEPPKPKLSAIEPQGVANITITRPQQERVVLAKEGTRWRLEEPLRAPANDTKMQSLLGLLGETSQESFPAKDHDLKRFGLAEPAVMVEFDNERFALGDTNPLNAQRYVLYRDRVHLVFESVYNHLEGEAASFASPRLTEEGREPVRIALPGRTLTREGKRGWTMSPAEPDVTTDALTRLADEWRYARAITVRRLDPKKKFEGNIMLAFKEGEPVSYAILAKAPDLILARPDLGLEYQIAGAAGKLLLEPERKTPSETASKPETPAVN